MNKIFKIGFIGLVVVFLLLFISYENGYYEQLNHAKTVMTDEMIIKYEEDLANGVDVSKVDYKIPKNDYENVYTKASLKASSKIESVIDGVIKFLFKKVNEVVGE